ncbi:MAG: hypothetical protein ACERKN_22320 [Velocimicrobium sp.]
MDKVKVDLHKCFGINKLIEEFDFSEDNVYAIYARNGLMKTSFSKTFKKIQENRASEIRDEIFDEDGSAIITIDTQPIKASDIFVIKSFENSYESSSITSLLVDEDVKEKIKTVLKLKDKFLKLLENRSGLKVAKTSGGKKVYELEPTIVKDFGFSEESFLLNLSELAVIEPSYDCNNITYSNIFDDSVLKKIESSEFQEKIEEFVKKSDEIYNNYSFLEKGNLTLPKLKDILKSLEKDKFFIKKNLIVLDGSIEIGKSDELKKKIDEIEAEIKAVPVFQDIEKLLSDVKGSALKDIIETNPDIVKYLKIENMQQLKIELWSSYIKAEWTKFSELCNEYKRLEETVKDANFEDSPWKKALKIFEERFTVPYKMNITNLKGAIIGESIPRVEFSFEKDGMVVSLDRNKLEDIDVLSQGERRALYLLNIIFDIENRNILNQETLFIVDDIADSFDYKNKYAIVEYLYEMAQNPKFKMIILSHNFDFYRTISSRLGVSSDNRLFASCSNDEVFLSKEKYQNQPFVFWKKNLSAINCVALIPFMRNIIEYGDDRNLANIVGIDKDYMLLTHLLHQKEETSNITFGDLKGLFKSYLGNETYLSDVQEADSVEKKIYDLADNINVNNSELEYKIIISMAIRHVAEKHMISSINAYSGQLMWEKRRRQMTGNSLDFMHYISSVGNQTRELFEVYKQIGMSNDIETLEEVNIMTPENIHLNSFMYEPILDMDIIELLALYRKVKQM